MFPNVSLSVAGSYDVVVTGPGGSVTSPVPAAVVSVINPAVFVTGQWDFLSNNLAATYGNDLQYGDARANGRHNVRHDDKFWHLGHQRHTYPSDALHPEHGSMVRLPDVSGAAPNGGGSYINRYTLVFDLYYPPNSDSTWRSLWQTATGNGNDADLFVGTSDGLGISSVYNGYISAGAWHRIAAAFDLTGPGSPVLTKFVDGVKVGNQTLSDGIDGRWSLDPYALVFADNDGDVAETYVSSIQFSNGRRPDAYLEALGGPSAMKIPGAIKASMINGAVTVLWTGGVALQSADSVNGTWTTVPNTAGKSSYTPSPLSTAKFYRPQIP